MTIKLLSNNTINKIAAGEVVERPASALKEILENAIDAGATKIDIVLEKSGKNLILVSDNGSGMSEQDLKMSIVRHATSKLAEEDLFNITSFGFRGEALASISSISRLKISSKTEKQEYGLSLSVHGGEIISETKTSMDTGTVVEIRDLFFATPARLKFLRTDKTELAACILVARKIALVYPNISFSLSHDGKEIFRYRENKSFDPAQAMESRITEILGQDFVPNASSVLYQDEELTISGYCSMPTFNRATADDQFLFVNNRPIKDKILSVALRVAYQDFLSRDRHPLCALFINVPPHLVDVNVHPAKTEVRFFDQNIIRSAMIRAIKSAISLVGQKTSTTIASDAVSYIQKNISKPSFSLENKIEQLSMQGFGVDADSISHRQASPIVAAKVTADNFFSDRSSDNFRGFSSSLEEVIDSVTETKVIDNASASAFLDTTRITQNRDQNMRLGVAIAQLHKKYIIARAQDSIIIVDQHAAHERIGYEKIKEQSKQGTLPSQRLLIPEIVELPDEERAELIQDAASELLELGMRVQKFGNKSIVVHEVPMLIENANVNALIQDISDHLLSYGANLALSEKIEHITETYACHYSIRAGRQLSINEMNELLSQMEIVDFSGQCNHGRPTYVELKISDIDKLFGRK